MHEMTFAHPIELSNEQLDLVAAGGTRDCNSGCNTGCNGGGVTIGIGIDIDLDVNVSLGKQEKCW
ncbi:hypothetical protein [Bradyrhizobium sp. DASA03120]|uniref:hypothetical protein n=1 Tax=Bradyrhizobium sp. SMVTL-02 TaxID=3395917 RepID=UPI003F720FC6